LSFENHEEQGAEMSQKRYPVVIERTSTVGDTEEETRTNFRNALTAHFEIMRRIGDPVPEPSSSVDYVEVAA
jgi:predicted RNase H-like HicB family nuclease